MWRTKGDIPGKIAPCGWRLPSVGVSWEPRRWHWPWGRLKYPFRTWENAQKINLPPKILTAVAGKCQPCAFLSFIRTLGHGVWCPGKFYKLTCTGDRELDTDAPCKSLQSLSQNPHVINCCPSKMAHFCLFLHFIQMALHSIKVNFSLPISAARDWYLNYGSYDILIIYSRWKIWSCGQLSDHFLVISSKKCPENDWLHLQHRRGIPGGLVPWIQMRNPQAIRLSQLGPVWDTWGWVFQLFHANFPRSLYSFASQKCWTIP